MMGKHWVKASAAILASMMLVVPQSAMAKKCTSTACKKAAAAKAKAIKTKSTQSKSSSGTSKVAGGSISLTPSAPLNINTAGKDELAPVPVLSSDAKWHILNFRQGAPYADAADLASKVCSRVAVDFGSTDIIIGTTVYTGFHCTTPADGVFVANGTSYSYTLPVELTGSDIIPPAPPGP